MGVRLDHLFSRAYLLGLNLLTVSIFALCFFFLWNLKKRTAYEKAIALTFILTALFLKAEAKEYFRYILTLVPFIIAALMVYSWDAIEKKGRFLKTLYFIPWIVIIVLNIEASRKAFTFYWNYKIFPISKHFPSEMIAFINALPADNGRSVFLIESDRQVFFYHTNKIGLYYGDPRINEFNECKTKARALDVLKRKLSIRYIYVHVYVPISPLLQDIISDDCELLFRDRENGFFLYRIREDSAEEPDLETIILNQSLLKNGSFEKWTENPMPMPTDFTANDQISIGMIEKESRDKKSGRFSAKVKGDNFNLGQAIEQVAPLRGQPVTVFVWMKSSVPNKFRVQVFDGIDSSFSDRHSGRGKWELLQVNHRVNRDAPSLLVRVIQAERTGNSNDVVYVDGALMVRGDWNTFYAYLASKQGKIP